MRGRARAPRPMTDRHHSAGRPGSDRGSVGTRRTSTTELPATVMCRSSSSAHSLPVDVTLAHAHDHQPSRPTTEHHLHGVLLAALHMAAGGVTELVARCRGCHRVRRSDARVPSARRRCVALARRKRRIDDALEPLWPHKNTVRLCRRGRAPSVTRSVHTFGRGGIRG